MMQSYAPRRVVVTGIGLLTPLGNDTAANWAAMVAGRSGIGRITSFDASMYEHPIAGELKDFDPEQHVEAKLLRRIDRSSVLAMAAAQQAVTDAGLDIANEPPGTVGVVLGTGI